MPFAGDEARIEPFVGDRAELATLFALADDSPAALMRYSEPGRVWVAPIPATCVSISVSGSG